MSGRMVGEVFKNAPEDLTQLQLLVLATLAESARESTRTATHETDLDTLAWRVRSTPSSVKRALFDLRRRGLIIGVFEKPRRGLTQHYRIPPLHPHHRHATSPDPQPTGVTPINPDTGGKGCPPTTQHPVENHQAATQKG